VPNHSGSGKLIAGYPSAFFFHSASASFPTSPVAQVFLTPIFDAIDAVEHSFGLSSQDGIRPC
jgi:hypothetical protein